MKANSPIRLVAAAALALLPWLPADSATRLWTLQDVTFDDGGTAFGSFGYDADTGTYSSIDISTTVGSVLSAQHFGTVPGPCGASSATGLRTFADSDFRCFDVFYAGPLTNGGGTLALLFTSNEVSYEGQRYVTAGSVSSVPLPAAVWLFGGALGALGVLKRRAKPAA